MSAVPRKKIRLGDLLVANQLISEKQLMQALADQKKTGKKLGRTLIDNGLVSEQQMLELLSAQLKLPFIDLRQYNYEADTIRLIPETMARRYRAIALKENPDGSLLVGMSDPTDIFAYDELSKRLKRPIHLAVAREAEILNTIDSIYRRTADISNLAEQLGEELSETDIDLNQMLQNEDLANAPVVRLLQTIFEDAIQIGASDIHIEPDENVLRIRQRVDGVLQEQVMNERRIATAVVSRLKLMAGLNISERRIPQDIRSLVLQGLLRVPEERPTAGAFGEACAEVIRRRGMGHGPDRVARLLSQLDLIDGDAPEVHLPGAKVPSLVDSDLMHHAGQELIGPHAVTSPIIYRVQLTDGSVMGPMSYPRLIQLLTTGVIDSRSSKISKSDGTYIDPSQLPELTRFVTSPGLQWKLEELAQAEKQGQLRAATLLPVFYDIIAKQQTGVLHLWQRNRRKKIYFVDGRPDFVASTDKAELLGEYLVATGRCLRMEIEMALALLPKYGGRLGDALVGLGILRPVELFRAISDQVRGRLMESFRWRHGEWAFVRGARSHEETFPTGQDPYELLRDAANEAHLEEIESVLEPLRERVVERCEDGPPLTVFRLDRKSVV